MYKLGADPEVFIYSTVNHKIVSVEGLIASDGVGTKQNPLEIESGFAIQEDNVLAEFNIPPCTTKQQWVDSLDFGLNAINVCLPDDYVYKIQTSHEMDVECLKTQQSLEIGCEPDLNAWTHGENKHEFTGTLRCAGGHIHVGINDESKHYNPNFIRQSVKAMDLFLAIPSLLLDTDVRRREIYGSAGSFRYKDYGFEYRTLSNFWLASVELQKWVWDQTMKALEFDGEIPENVEEIINTNNIELAQLLCEEFNINLPVEKVYQK